MSLPSTPERLRVVQVSTFGPPHLGGLETCAESFFERIPGDDLEMRWLLADVPHLPGRPGTRRLGVWNFVEDLWSVPVPIPEPSWIRELWRSIRSSDLGHIHDVMYLTSVLAALVARAQRRPILITLHIIQVPYGNPILRLLQGAAWHTIGRLCLRLASRVVTYNRLIVDQLGPAYGAKLELVENGIGDEFVGVDVSPTEYEAARRRLGLERGRRIVLFAGRFSPKKGLGLIREMAEQLPDCLFLFCGAGAVDPRGWRLTNVRVAGQLSHPELRDYLVASDLFLLPSKGEGFPFAILEAMSCGLPCAVFHSTWAGLAERPDLFVLLADGKLLPQVADFLDRPVDFGWRQAISEFARARWNWATTVDRYRALYKSLAAGRRSAPDAQLARARS